MSLGPFAASYAQRPDTTLAVLRRAIGIAAAQRAKHRADDAQPVTETQDRETGEADE